MMYPGMMNPYMMGMMNPMMMHGMHGMHHMGMMHPYMGHGMMMHPMMGMHGMHGMHHMGMMGMHPGMMGMGMMGMHPGMMGMGMGMHQQQPLVQVNDMSKHGKASSESADRRRLQEESDDGEDGLKLTVKKCLVLEGEEEVMVCVSQEMDGSVEVEYGDADVDASK